MTTVAELIAKLQTLPQHAEVEVMKEIDGAWTTETMFDAVDLSEVNVVDFTDEQSMKRGGRLAGRVFVEIHAC